MQLFTMLPSAVLEVATLVTMVAVVVMEKTPSNACQFQIVTLCPCGEQKHPAPVLAKSCLMDGRPGTKRCQPCPGVCEAFALCEFCSLRSCLTCPPGRWGPFCERKAGVASDYAHGFVAPEGFGMIEDFIDYVNPSLLEDPSSPKHPAYNNLNASNDLNYDLKSDLRRRSSNLDEPIANFSEQEAKLKSGEGQMVGLNLSKKPERNPGSNFQQKMNGGFGTGQIVSLLFENGDASAETIRTGRNHSLDSERNVSRINANSSKPGSNSNIGSQLRSKSTLESQSELNLPKKQSTDQNIESKQETSTIMRTKQLSNHNIAKQQLMKQFFGRVDLNANLLRDFEQDPNLFYNDIMFNGISNYGDSIFNDINNFGDSHFYDGNISSGKQNHFYSHGGFGTDLQLFGLLVTPHDNYAANKSIVEIHDPYRQKSLLRSYNWNLSSLYTKNRPNVLDNFSKFAQTRNSSLQPGSNFSKEKIPGNASDTINLRTKHRGMSKSRRRAVFTGSSNLSRMPVGLNGTEKIVKSDAGYGGISNSLVKDVKLHNPFNSPSVNRTEEEITLNNSKKGKSNIENVPLHSHNKTGGIIIPSVGNVSNSREESVLNASEKVKSAHFMFHTLHAGKTYQKLRPGICAEEEISVPYQSKGKNGVFQLIRKLQCIMNGTKQAILSGIEQKLNDAVENVLNVSLKNPNLTFQKVLQSTLEDTLHGLLKILNESVKAIKGNIENTFNKVLGEIASATLKRNIIETLWKINGSLLLATLIESAEVLDDKLEATMLDVTLEEVLRKFLHILKDNIENNLNNNTKEFVNVTYEESFNRALDNTLDGLWMTMYGYQKTISGKPIILREVEKALRGILQSLSGSYEALNNASENTINVLGKSLNDLEEVLYDAIDKITNELSKFMFNVLLNWIPNGKPNSHCKECFSDESDKEGGVEMKECNDTLENNDENRNCTVKKIGTEVGTGPSSKTKEDSIKRKINIEKQEPEMPVAIRNHGVITQKNNISKTKEAAEMRQEAAEKKGEIVGNKNGGAIKQVEMAISKSDEEKKNVEGNNDQKNGKIKDTNAKEEDTFKKIKDTVTNQKTIVGNEASNENKQIITEKESKAGSQQRVEKVKNGDQVGEFKIITQQNINMTEEKGQRNGESKETLSDKEDIFGIKEKAAEERKGMPEEVDNTGENKNAISVRQKVDEKIDEIINRKHMLENKMVTDSKEDAFEEKYKALESKEEASEQKIAAEKKEDSVKKLLSGNEETNEKENYASMKKEIQKDLAPKRLNANISSEITSSYTTNSGEVKADISKQDIKEITINVNSKHEGNGKTIPHFTDVNGTNSKKNITGTIYKTWKDHALYKGKGDGDGEMFSEERNITGTIKEMNTYVKDYIYNETLDVKGNYKEMDIPHKAFSSNNDTVIDEIKVVNGDSFPGEKTDSLQKFQKRKGHQPRDNYFRQLLMNDWIRIHSGSSFQNHHQRNHNYPKQLLKNETHRRDTQEDYASRVYTSAEFLSRASGNEETQSENSSHDTKGNSEKKDGSSSQIDQIRKKRDTLGGKMDASNQASRHSLSPATELNSKENEFIDADLLFNSIPGSSQFDDIPQDIHASNATNIVLQSLNETRRFLEDLKPDIRKEKEYQSTEPKGETIFLWKILDDESTSRPKDAINFDSSSRIPYSKIPNLRAEKKLTTEWAKKKRDSVTKLKVYQKKIDSPTGEKMFRIQMIEVPVSRKASGSIQSNKTIQIASHLDTLPINFLQRKVRFGNNSVTPPTNYQMDDYDIPIWHAVPIKQLPKNTWIKRNIADVSVDDFSQSQSSPGNDTYDKWPLLFLNKRHQQFFPENEYFSRLNNMGNIFPFGLPMFPFLPSPVLSRGKRVDLSGDKANRMQMDEKENPFLNGGTILPTNVSMNTSGQNHSEFENFPSPNKVFLLKSEVLTIFQPHANINHDWIRNKDYFANQVAHLVKEVLVALGSKMTDETNLNSLNLSSRLMRSPVGEVEPRNINSHKEWQPESHVKHFNTFDNFPFFNKHGYGPKHSAARYKRSAPGEDKISANSVDPPIPKCTPEEMKGAAVGGSKGARPHRLFKRSMPHNHWCVIPLHPRHGNLECTIWTYKKRCKLTCHKGFQLQSSNTFECTRKVSNWVPPIKPCDPATQKPSPQPQKTTGAPSNQPKTTNNQPGPSRHRDSRSCCGKKSLESSPSISPGLEFPASDRSMDSDGGKLCLVPERVNLLNDRGPTARIPLKGEDLDFSTPDEFSDYDIYAEYPELNDVYDMGILRNDSLSPEYMLSGELLP